MLVAGLFVMVDAVESQGALKFTQQWLAWATGLGQNVGALVVGFVVGVANNVVNNLPLGLIAGGTIQAAHTKGLIANAVLIGVDLGPNLRLRGRWRRFSGCWPFVRIPVVMRTARGWM